jgi:hypothetical protein
MHCNENPISVFPGKELRDLRPNCLIHVIVSDLYIPRIGPHIFLQQNMQIAHGHMNVDIGTVAAQLLFGNICFEYSVLCL